jgi:hypothetical protein
MRILILWACCIAILVACTSAADSGSQSPEGPLEYTLNPRIPRSKPAQYRAVREPREWRNPRLDVTDRGFELRSRSLREPSFVPLEDLRRVLTELPLTDWPYGRVVVVQNPGIGPADPEWWQAVKQNADGARKVLRALGADDWGWPT